MNGPRLGPIWASPFSFFSKYDIIVLNITQLKRCLVMSLGIDKKVHVLDQSEQDQFESGDDESDYLFVGALYVVAVSEQKTR